MHTPFQNTWTVSVILSLCFLEVSFGLPLNNETMFDAVVKKCPLLKNTHLKTNDIFTKKCMNWAAINATKTLTSETQDNLQCLVYYESLVSFCTELGEKLFQNQLLLNLDNPNTDLDQICSSNHTIFPANKKLEHELATIIKGKPDCLLLCLTFTESKVSDLCQYAFYYSNFNVSMLPDAKNAVKGIGHIDDVQKHPQPIISKGDKGLAEAPSQEGKVAVVKPQKTEKDEPVVHDAVSLLENNHQSTVDPFKNQLIPNGVQPESKNETDHKDTHKNVFPAKEPEPGIAGVAGPNNIPKQQKPDSVKDNGDKKQLDKQDDAIAKQDKLDKPEQNLEDPNEVADKQNDFQPQDELEDEEAGDLGVGEGEEEKVEAIMPGEPEAESVKKVKPNTVEDEPVNSMNTSGDDMDGDSYFFSYFTVITCLFIVGYVGYHNRQKILALILEGKRGRRGGRTRRPNSANYHKLDSNLEEAISSPYAKTATNVIY